MGTLQLQQRQGALAGMRVDLRAQSALLRGRQHVGGAIFYFPVGAFFYFFLLGLLLGILRELLRVIWDFA